MRYLCTILLLAIISSCKNTGCTEFGTENYDPEAVINDGSCILVRDKFLGTFQVDSDCFSDTYLRSITPTDNEFMVTISNLADTLGNVEARVYAENITIEPQLLQPFLVVEGAGIYTGDDRISISYKVRDSRSGTTVTYDCFEWCTKL